MLHILYISRYQPRTSPIPNPNSNTNTSSSSALALTKSRLQTASTFPPRAGRLWFCQTVPHHCIRSQEMRAWMSKNTFRSRLSCHKSWLTSLRTRGLLASPSSLQQRRFRLVDAGGAEYTNDHPWNVLVCLSDMRLPAWSVCSVIFCLVLWESVVSFVLSFAWLLALSRLSSCLVRDSLVLPYCLVLG